MATAHRVLVFTTPTCPWGTRAKAYLRGRGVPFLEIDGRPIVGFDQARIAERRSLRVKPVGSQLRRLFDTGTT